MATILRLIPKGRLKLPDHLRRGFPHKLQSREVLVSYVSHLLNHVLDYVPTIHGDVLQMCIECCLEIDVEIRIHDNGGASLNQKGLLQENDEESGIDGRNDGGGVFELDPDVCYAGNNNMRKGNATVIRSPVVKYRLQKMDGNRQESK